jgi:phosphoribosylformimino-5-aminoimidazole carboxamide ribonucleotide (ProFAR) isomerase
LKYTKVYGAIVGKAIYEGKLNLAELKAFQNS